jgi:very-short-patch-repair endonuclease
MTDTLRRLVRDRVEKFGWRPGTDLEDSVALWFHTSGHQPDTVKQQHRVGRFRLDFAFPDVQIAIEADGWHHRSPEGAAWDAERDSWLRSQGWIVLRVDERQGKDSFDEQMARVCQLVHQIRGTRG